MIRDSFNRKKKFKRILLFLRITVKMKKGEKLNKYLDLARELKMLWNVKVTDIPVVVETIPKNLEKKLNELEINKN